MSASGNPQNDSISDAKIDTKHDRKHESKSSKARAKSMENLLVIASLILVVFIMDAVLFRGLGKHYEEVFALVALVFISGLMFWFRQISSEISSERPSRNRAPPPRARPRNTKADAERSVIGYNMTIDEAAQSGDSARAEELLATMLAGGKEANAITYNSVIHACAKNGDSHRAAYWLEKMIAGG